MDLIDSLAAVNYLAVAAAALSGFLVGGLWYSALFTKPWMQANGFTESDLQRGNTGVIFGGSFLLALVIAFSLALFLGPERDLVLGSSAGFMAGAFWVAAAYGITYLFERKPLKLFLINAGYHVLTFTVMGAILGAWR